MGQFWSRLRRLWPGRRHSGRGNGASEYANHRTANEPTSSVGAVDGEDRREWPRVKLEVAARIRFPTAEAAIESRTFDISRGGVFLQMPQPRPPGTIVRLVIEIGERTLMVAGEVARVSNGQDGLPGMGVRFTEISADDVAYLEALIKARSTREPSAAVKRSTSRS